VNSFLIDFQDEVCIERKSVDDSSLSLRARHYGNHRSSLLYGGFLDSTCSYHKDSATNKKSGPDGTNVLCQQNGDTLEESDESILKW
jgi:hypothetical protein